MRCWRWVATLAIRFWPDMVACHEAEVLMLMSVNVERMGVKELGIWWAK